MVILNVVRGEARVRLNHDMKNTTVHKYIVVNNYSVPATSVATENSSTHL